MMRDGIVEVNGSRVEWSRRSSIGEYGWVSGVDRMDDGEVDDSGKKDGWERWRNGRVDE